MKRNILFLLLPLLLLAACTKEPAVSTTTISKIEFYKGWVLGEENMIYLGSTEDPDFVLKNAYFDVAIYSGETLQTMNIKIKNNETEIFTKEINLDDYEVMRRRYKSFGYYVLSFTLDDYINKSLDYNLEISGTTETNKKYIYNYNGKANFIKY